MTNNPYIAARQAFKQAGLTFGKLKQAEQISYSELSDEDKAHYDWADENDSFIRIEWSKIYTEVRSLGEFMRHGTIGLAHDGYSDGVALYVHDVCGGDGEIIVTQFGAAKPIEPTADELARLRSAGQTAQIKRQIQDEADAKYHAYELRYAKAVKRVDHEN